MLRYPTTGVKGLLDIFFCITDGRERDCFLVRRVCTPVVTSITLPLLPRRLRPFSAFPDGGLQGLQAWPGRRGLR